MSRRTTTQKTRKERLPQPPSASSPGAPHHRVYVVRLDHPRAKGRPAYYVGMTGLPVEERFANHLRGHKSSRVVHKYGVELAFELFDDIPPMPYDEAAQAEPTLADDLRDLGYLVFGPTNRREATRARRRSR